MTTKLDKTYLITAERAHLSCLRRKLKPYNYEAHRSCDERSYFMSALRDAGRGMSACAVQVSLVSE